LQADSLSLQYIKKWEVAHFYLRYFDVDWSEAYGKGIPKGILQLSSLPYHKPAHLLFDNGQALTPVVYITNRTFERIRPEDIPMLAANVFHKTTIISKEIASQVAETHFPWDEGSNWDSLSRLRTQDMETFLKEIPEFQIDCDWTENTRENYFSFLTEYKKLIEQQHAQLSVTLRLYPYKYSEKMGIPPAHRALLMCYNTGNIHQSSTENSILDYKTAAAYFTREAAYPLPLDIGLPIFSWGVWFREGKYRSIIHQIDHNWLENPALFEQTKNEFTCKQDTLMGEYYLREGDLIRWEKPQPEDLNKTAQLIRKTHVGSPPRVAFFNWDTAYIHQYEKEIPAIYQGFQ
jgi:hypothetical protein